MMNSLFSNIKTRTRSPWRRRDSPIKVNFARHSRGFTLFEVLIALAVFSIAVTGLAIALDTVVQSALEARQRVLTRLELESRIAYNMIDPPLSGERTIDAASNHGVAIKESATLEQLQDAQNQPLTGIYRLQISAQIGQVNDSAEILIYHP